MSLPVKCEICGKEVKNLGSHMHQAHPNSNAKFITDKEFANTLLQIRDILKSYRHRLETTIIEQGGEELEARLSITIHMK